MTTAPPPLAEDRVDISDKTVETLSAILLGDLPALPNNPNGRRLVAQTAFWNAVQAAAGLLDNPEARSEAQKIGRTLGFVERSTRGPRKATESAPTTPAPMSPTTTQNGSSTVAQPTPADKVNGKPSGANK